MKRCVCKTLLSFFQQFKDAPPVAKFLLLSSELSNYSFLPFSSSSFLKLDFPKTHLLLPLCIRTDCGFLLLPPRAKGNRIIFHGHTEATPLLALSFGYSPVPSFLLLLYHVCSLCVPFDLVRLSVSPTAAH